MSPEIAPGTGPAADDALLGTDEAARVETVDLLAEIGGAQERLAGLNPVGPWAQEVAAVREEARRQGFAQGMDDGRQQGFEQGMAQAGQRCEAMSGALEQVMVQVEQRCDEVGQQLTDQLVGLALEIAAAVIGHEVAAADDPGAAAIVRCLDLAPSVGDLVVNLHPDDAARLGDVSGLAERTLTIVPDDRLEPGDAIVAVDQTTIDGRLGAALRRVGEVLA